eukprot:g4513.t1
MIMFSKNSRFEILMELKSSIADVSELIGGSTNETYPELQFVQDTPVTLLLSTIENIDVAQFNLGESCDGQTEQRRGLSVCGSLEATRNVTDIEDVAYTFTGSTMHQSTLVGSIRPVVQLESSSQNWSEITLSDQVWVTDVKIHFGHTESWLEAVVHVRLDQEDDQLEIPVNVTEESNHLYQLQADGHISKTWHLPNGQTLSVREIDLRLTYDKNRTNDQVYGEIDANVTLGHNVQMDLSLNLPMSVFQLVGHVRSTFSLNDLDGNTATEIQFTENAVVMFDHHGCRINATLDLDNLDPTLYNTIEDFHLSNNTREFIEISGSFDTHLRTFDFEASLRDFSLSSSLYFDFVKLHISSSVKRRFYLSCKANVLLHDVSPLTFDVSTTVQGDGIIHFKGNTSQVWNDASVSLTEFFMDLKRNVMSRETLDFNIEAKLIATDFQVQVSASRHEDECLEFSGALHWENDFDALALSATQTSLPIWQSVEVSSALTSSISSDTQIVFVPKCGRIEFSATIQNAEMGESFVLVNGTTSNWNEFDWLIAVETSPTFTFMSLKECCFVAIDALEASGAVLPDLDPVVITLRAAYAVEHAAWVFAEEALKTLGNDVCNAIQWIETQIVKLADLFNIEKIKISGSAKRLKLHDLGDVEIMGIVLGNDFDRTFEMNWSVLENIAGNIFADIVHSHTSDTNRRNAARYSHGGKFYLS